MPESPDEETILKNSVAQMLSAELDHRRRGNPNYSLRAFARDLGVSPAFVSYLLKGERSLSPDKAAVLAKKMNWNSHDSRLFVGLSRYQSTQSEPGRSMIKQDLEGIKKKFTKFENLKVDQFNTIADWYHLAILELIEVEGFSSNPTWIAQRLGISVTEASRALDRLIRLKLVAILPDGNLQKLKNNGVRDTPSGALRQFHQQHLKNAYRAIDQVPFEKRHASGTTVAIDPENLPQAEAMIKDFRASLSALLSAGCKKDVYHLAIQLFPLSGGIKND
jgi:uncharacterized protein (TIGR02147 family)